METFKGLSIVIEHNAGVIDSVRLLKSRSGISDPLLEDVNNGLKQAFAKPVQPTKTTVEIGNLGEQQVLSYLQKISQTSDLEVFDRSSEAGHGDISVSYKDINICIEVKNYKCALPQAQLDKYHKSLALDEYQSGIIICMQQGYAKGANIRTPIDIKYHQNKPSVYLSCVDLQLLYPIIEIIRTMIQSNENTQEHRDINELIQRIEIFKEKLGDLKTLVEAQKKITSKLEKSIADMCLI